MSKVVAVFVVVAAWAGSTFVPYHPGAYQVQNGTETSNHSASHLAAIDANNVSVLAATVGGLARVDILCDAFPGSQPPPNTSGTLNVHASAMTSSSGGPIRLDLSLLNWQTGAHELVHSGTAPALPTTIVVSLADVSRYVNASGNSRLLIRAFQSPGPPWALHVNLAELDY